MNFNQMTTDLATRPARKRVSDLVNDLRVVHLAGPVDVGVDFITSDSRLVRDRSLFVALAGEHTDGHRFVQQAIEQGASCVVVGLEEHRAMLAPILSPSFLQHHQTVLVVVQDPRSAFARIADRFYDSPTKQLRLIGITGTNGKTTSSFLIKSILEQTGEQVGLIGTVGYHIGDRRYDAPFTTPLPDRLQELFREMVRGGCTSVVMEVSSHALALCRVEGLDFALSLFTNLTQDHLDFHGTMEEYERAKKMLFDENTSGFAVLNGDDPAAARLAEHTPARKLFFGFDRKNDVCVQELALSTAQTRLALHTPTSVFQIASPLLGRFNAANVTGAAAVGHALRIEPAQIRRGIELVRNVPGRFERIRSAGGVTAVVDYSHTPDSLQKCLEAIRDIFVSSGSQGRIITVFGCGGDRDRAKRPLMARIAERGSDRVYVTSDNPRTEEPQAIIDGIMKGFADPAAVRAIAERKSAIEEALAEARPGDLVLIAGKGHETYQLVGTERRHFDDREVVRDFFVLRGGGLAE